MGFLEQCKLGVKSPLVGLAAIILVSVGFQPPHRTTTSHGEPRTSSEIRDTRRLAEHGHEHQAASKARKLLPVDEAAKDPTFKAFRDTLIDAVKRKDTQFILGVLAPDILNDFGGGNGIQNFKTKWRLGKTEESKLWDELDTVLSMGGSFRVEEDKRIFWAPYVYSTWPDEFDCGEDAQCYAVTGDHVNARREPSSTAPIVASLSYDIVKSKIEDTESKKTPDGWTKVIVPGGAAGYVATRFLRSPIDYRAGFARVKGKWLITSFIAGD
jgi:hypothetical protein